MLEKTKMTVSRDYRIGDIDPRMYSAFLEPHGPNIYGGLYNPGHPKTDEQGFRTDVLAAIRELGIPAIRLPGGNFVSGYDWKDGIGPKDQRKVRLDCAWRQTEPNQFGFDEYLQWAEKSGAETLYTLNLGTRDINDAMNLVEYANYPGGTYWSDLRRKYGREKPYGIKTWYLGNEMDGPWEIGSKHPREYGKMAREFTKVIKWIDPSAETWACGTSSPLLRSYPKWDIEMLDECYELIDGISIHDYHNAPAGDYAQMLAGACQVEDFIIGIRAVCDYVQAKYRHPRKMKISFDEYALSVVNDPIAPHPGRGGQIPNEVYGEFTPRNLDRPFMINDPKNPPYRRNFNRRGSDIASMVGSASVLLTFLKYADRIRIGCMTGGLFTIRYDDEKVWFSSTYYLLRDLIRYGKGTALIPSIKSPTYNTEGFNINDFHQAPPYENVPYVMGMAVDNEEDGLVTVFAVNRSVTDAAPFEVDVRPLEGYEFVSHTTLESAADITAANTAENPNAIRPHAVPETACDGKTITAVLPPLSWNVFQMKKK